MFDLADTSNWLQLGKVNPTSPTIKASLVGQQVGQAVPDDESHAMSYLVCVRHSLTYRTDTFFILVVLLMLLVG